MLGACTDRLKARLQLRLTVILGICAILFSISAHAQVGIKLQLVNEDTAIVPGKPFRLGLFIQHDPGVHTYWKFPGIVGVATSIEWKLPPGFTAGELEYPEPEPTKMFQIKAQGFERDVLLQTLITPPADLKPGEKVTLTGKVSWMACGRTCNPGTKDLDLEISIAAQNQADPHWQPLFEKERAAYAYRSDAWTATAEEKDMTVLLKLTPQPGKATPFTDAAEAEKVAFFTEDGWINSDEPQTVTLAPDGTLSITLHRADVFLGKHRPSKLNGIVQRTGNWQAGGTFRSMIISPDLRQ